MGMARSRGRSLAAISAAALAAFVAPAASAQAPAARSTGITEVAAPDMSKAIPLGPRAPASAAPEQWEKFGGELIVRNVTSPTLTPFLPDPAKATGAAVIVAPGGGFLELSMDNEGYPVAQWLADHGVAAFLLKYRTRPTPRDAQGFLASLGQLMRGAATGSTARIDTPPEALADAQAAVRLVRARAQTWGVDPARVGFLGFSAGAMTTLSVGLAQDKAARPDFIGSIYGPMGPREVPADAPPMFVAVALDDPLMAQGKSIGLIDSWRTAKRPVEAHLYERGSHGFGMSGRRPASKLWIDEFYAWMADRGLLAGSRH